MLEPLSTSVHGNPSPYYKATQVNGFAEAFVEVLVKLIHTALVEGTDPRHMVNR